MSRFVRSDSRPSAAAGAAGSNDTTGTTDTTSTTDAVGSGGAGGSGGGSGAGGEDGATDASDFGDQSADAEQDGDDAWSDSASTGETGAEDAGSLGAVFAVGSFVKERNLASQTVPHSLGQAPKALLLWTVGCEGETPASNYTYAIGATTDPLASFSVAIGSRNFVAPAIANRRMALKALTIVVGSGVDAAAEADVSSWDPTSFTLRWTKNDGHAPIIHYAAIGGGNVSAKVVRWVAPTAPLSTTISTVGFQPEVVLHFYLGAGFTSAPPHNDVNAIVGWGAMDGTGRQWANHTFAFDQTDPPSVSLPSQSTRGQKIDQSVYMLDAPASPEISKAARFGSMNPNGFTLQFSSASASATQMFSLALAGVKASAGNFDKATGAAPLDQSVSAVGFKPGLILLTSVEAPALTGIALPDSRFAIGAADATHAASSAFSDANNVRPSSTSAVDRTSKAFVKMNNSIQSVEAESTLASFDADGFTLHWTANDSIATQICYVALGAK